MPDISEPTNEELAPWVNDEFLAAILRRDENDASLSVVKSTVEMAVPVGDNYASFLVRVAVEYNSSDDKETKKRSLMVKSVPAAEIMQQWIVESGVFPRELRIYEITLPAMYKLYEERTGDRLQIGPKVCHTDRPNTIVLHDLCPLGYKMANRRQGLDLEHSIMAIKTLAKFHAISLAMHENDPTAFDYYTEPFYIEEKRKILTDFMVPSFNNLASEVEGWSGYEQFGAKVKQIAINSVDKCIEMANNKDGALRVLNHGDFWTNNMLFLYKENGKIADVKMIDFQMIRFASPALDILYFLNMSPSQEVLDESREELIQEYLDQLNATLTRMDCKHLCLTRDQVDRELEDKAYFAVIISCLVCFIVAEPEDAPDMNSITQEDLDNGKFDAMNKAFAGKRFRQRFEKRLVQFENVGLI